MDDELFVADVFDLVHYADSMAKILREQGFAGKAIALEERCLQVFTHIAIAKLPQARGVSDSLLNKLRNASPEDKFT